jgi:hypothetical protein
VTACPQWRTGGETKSNREANLVAEEEEAEALSRKASLDSFTARRRTLESAGTQDRRLRAIEQAEARFFAQQGTTEQHEA